MERRTIVLISGSVSSGKSSLAGALEQRYGFRCLKTRELILKLRPRTRNERAALQRAGERLDKQQQGKWVAEAVARLVQDMRESIVVDSVRTKDQIDDVRRAFGSAVVHVHLVASDAVLAERYGGRSPVITELASYKAVRKNATEGLVNELERVADIVVDTERADRDEVTVRVAARLGLYGRGLERLVDVLVGGQYGSEGKGNIAAHLAPEYQVLVRVGGPNAGHQVYGESITTYHHLPSGTGRNEDAKILIGPGAVISVAGLLREVNEADLSTQRLVIDEHAMVIEEQDVQSEHGQLVGSIGSTGQGVGAATSRKILRTAAERRSRSSAVRTPGGHGARGCLRRGQARIPGRHPRDGAEPPSRQLSVRDVP
jgi:adenylosuccinate synthase